MSKELEVILQTTDTSRLNEKMEEAKYVYDIEGILLEKVKIANLDMYGLSSNLFMIIHVIFQTALLSELIEEWEQCERKLKEVNTFVDRTQQSLENQPGKKRTLRDQLASKEKLIADITIQKNKINMSVEKLEVSLFFE